MLPNNLVPDYTSDIVPSLVRKKVQVGNDQEKAQSEKDSHSKNRGGKKQTNNKKVQVGKDQEKAQSEKDSHSKNRGGKKPN